MKKLITILKIMVIMPFVIILSSQTMNAQKKGNGNGGNPHDNTETAGNNLSFPVIWADGGSKTLPGVMGEHSLNGVWWYVWGEDPVDPQGIIYSCKPSSTNPDKCEDGSDPGDGNSTVFKAYIQKDENNVWQAHNAPIPSGETLYINWLDWGDNLESLDWTINSQVRTEIVLLQDIDSVTQFNMRHVDSWGTDEVHGLQTTLEKEVIYGPGTQATIYSPNARLTIQKLNVESLGELTDKLYWIPISGWTETNISDNLINDPILNNAIYEAGDGPSFFSAEINVKGKIIYGFTWNLKEFNEGPGYYRITFSFDEGNGVSGTAKFDDSTQIILPIEEVPTEEVIITASEGTSGGGTGIIDVANNLTYMDVYIIEKNSGRPNDSVETFTMYPNPSTGTLTIEGTTSKLMTIYDIYGIEVFRTSLSGNIDAQSIDISELDQGIYIVQVSQGKNATSKQLILN